MRKDGLYKKADIVFASLDEIRQIAEGGQHKLFVWPDEGEFVKGGFQMNEAHAGQYEPLLIDLITAKLLWQMHGLLNDSNAAKCAAWMMKGRGHFAKVVEIAWKHVK